MEQTVFFASVVGVAIISFLTGMAFQTWRQQRQDNE